MEDSLRGTLVALTYIGVFIMAIIGFITFFPQGQGVTFSGADNDSYLIVQNNTNMNVNQQLTTISNQTEDAFNQWDVTSGFMGSGTMKQTSGTGITSYFKLVTTSVSAMATQLFGMNSPIVIAMGIFISAGIGYLIWLAYKFVRTGN